MKRKALSIMLIFSIMLMAFANANTSKAAKPKKPVIKSIKATDNYVTFTLKSKPKNGSYLIYRSTKKTGKYKYLGATEGKKYVDKKVKPKTKYFYKVRLFNGYQHSRYSKIRSIQTKNKTSSKQNNASSSFQQEVLRLVNIERSKYGLKKLTTTKKLENAANERAREISTHFSHVRPNGKSCFSILEDYGISCMACAENIASGQTTPKQVVEDFMNSYSHRVNILSENYHKLGVGYYNDNWVQIFTD